MKQVTPERAAGTADAPPAPGAEDFGTHSWAGGRKGCQGSPERVSLLKAPVFFFSIVVPLSREVTALDY